MKNLSILLVLLSALFVAGCSANAEEAPAKEVDPAVKAKVESGASMMPPEAKAASEAGPSSRR
jgi:PBP1b-binding outer membrane lipoprotein LpoB